MKIVCPYCGSTEIRFYEEKVFTYYYKIKLNGVPYKRGRKSSNFDSGASGYFCGNCSAFSGTIGMDDWEK